MFKGYEILLLTTQILVLIKAVTACFELKLLFLKSYESSKFKKSIILFTVFSNMYKSLFLT